MIRWHEFTGCDQPALLREIEALRDLVWSAEGLIDRAILRLDALDQSAHHVVAFDDDLLVASSQVSLHLELATMRDGAHFAPCIDNDTFPAAVLNRLVVRPSHHGRGLAASMDQRRIERARRWRVRSVLTEVKGRRTLALESLGFIRVGESPDLRYPGTWSIMQKTMSSLADRRGRRNKPALFASRRQRPQPRSIPR